MYYYYNWRCDTIHKLTKNLLLSFLLIAIVVVLISLCNGVSADTHYTHASGNAGTAATWINGVPSAGDNLVFQGNYAITMNQAITYGSITLLANYTNTVSQSSVSFGYTSFSQANGNWNGASSPSHWQSCSGNFIKTSGSILAGSLQLEMTGNGVTLNVNAAIDLYSYRTTDGASVNINNFGVIVRYLVTNDGTTMLSGSASLVPFSYTGFTITNNGLITGTTLTLYAYQTDFTFNPKDITVTTINIITYSTAGGNRKITLTGPLDCDTATVYILSSHAVYTMTFDINGNDATFNKISLQTRGIIRNNAGVVCYLHAHNGLITNTGTFVTTNILYGWTDWKPTITSSPTLSILGNHEYSYHMTQNETARVAISYSIYWLTLSNNNSITETHYLNGTAPLGGTFDVYLTFYSMRGQLIAYQNFTISVIGWSPEFTSSPITTLYTNENYIYHVELNETSTTLLMYSVSGFIFQINNTNGVSFHLFGSSAIETVLSISIRAQSISGGMIAYQNFTVTVSNRPSPPPMTWKPYFTSIPLIVLQAGPYSYHITLNESGNVWLMYAVSGLSITNNGTTANHYLNGTLTAGNYNVVLRAYSTAGQQYQWQNFSITVSAIPPVLWKPQFVSTPITIINIGHQYSYEVLLNESGSVSLLYSIPWLTLSNNNSNGAHFLNGTPTGLGTYNVRLRAIGVGQLSEYQNFSIQVVQLNFTTTPDLNGTVNQTYTYVPITNHTAILTVLHCPSWIVVHNNGTTYMYLSGYTNISGNATFNITASIGNHVVYQNWTAYMGINIGNGISVNVIEVLWILVLCILTIAGLYALGVFAVLGGIVWILAGLLWANQYHVALTIVFIGFGMLLMALGLNTLMQGQTIVSRRR